MVDPLEEKLWQVFRERDEWGTASDLLRSLEEQGLHVVSQADKAVLDAMALVPEVEVEISLDLRDHMSVQERRAWEAELARRGEEA